MQGGFSVIHGGKMPNHMSSNIKANNVGRVENKSVNIQTNELNHYYAA